MMTTLQQGHPEFAPCAPAGHRALKAILVEKGMQGMEWGERQATDSIPFLDDVRYAIMRLYTLDEAALEERFALLDDWDARRGWGWRMDVVHIVRRTGDGTGRSI